MVKIYALWAMSSSSKAPTLEKKGKGIVVQGTFSVNGVSVEFCLILEHHIHSSAMSLCVAWVWNPRFVIDH